MNNRFIFNQAFSYYFFPVDREGDKITPSSDNPSIWVFAKRPTLTEASTGNGAIAGIHVTTWASQANGSYRIDVPEIDDPDPLEDMDSELPYYLAINFKLEGDDGTTTLLKLLTMSRVVGQGEALAITQEDLASIDGSVAAIFGDDSTTIEAINDAVIRGIKSRFRAEGRDFGLIDNPKALKDAAIFLGLELAFGTQIQTPGDRFDRKSQLYGKRGADSLGALLIDFDTNADGIIDSSDGNDEKAEPVEMSWEIER